MMAVCLVLFDQIFDIYKILYFFIQLKIKRIESPQDSKIRPHIDGGKSSENFHFE